MRFEKFTIQGIASILLLQSSFRYRVHADIIDCIVASNATLFSSSTEYADAYYELFDSGTLWQNFYQCQYDFLQSSMPYDETCEIDRELDPMFNRFLVACQEAGGIMYVTDDTFLCNDNFGHTINVSDKNSPYCIIPESTSCEGTENDLLTMTPEAYSLYTDLGYDCQVAQFDFYLYSNEGVDDNITEPPITDVIAQCLTGSNETLFSTSAEYSQAYRELFDGGPLWQNFVQCQNDFLNAVYGYVESCVLDMELDSMFQRYVAACQEAGGNLYVMNSAFQCIKTGFSIDVVDRNYPYCILPEVTSCERIQNVELGINPEAYDVYAESGYYCQSTQLDFHPYGEIDNETLSPLTPDAYADCINSSNATLFSMSTDYAEAYFELNEIDKEWEDWIQCQTDFLETSIAYDATCDYDYKVDPFYYTYASECKDAGGVMYVVDYRIQCGNSDSLIIIEQKNNPKCIVPEVASCETVLGGTGKLVVPGPLHDQFIDSGFTCETVASNFHILEEESNNNNNLNEPIEESNGISDEELTEPPIEEQPKDVFDACISTSYTKILLKNSQYGEVYTEMFESDKESNDWIKCQIDFIKNNDRNKVGNNATCYYDYKVDYIYDAYTKECKEAGGTVYVADYHVECNKANGRNTNQVDIIQKNNPFCILPDESSCKEILGIELDVKAPLNKNFTQAGFSCTALESIFYPLEEGSTNNSKMTDDNKYDNFPVIIGIVVAVAVAIIGMMVSVFYRRRQRRKQYQKEQTAKNPPPVINIVIDDDDGVENTIPTTAT